MEQLEKIIRYLDGEVIGEEKQSFEKELTTNSSLRDTFNIVKDVDKTLSDEELVNFVKKIQKINSSFTKETYSKKQEVIISENKKAISFLIKKRFLSAAAVLLIFAISTILYVNFEGPKNDRIFNQFYTKYEASLITRSDNSETNDLIIAIQLYDKGKYTEAIAKLNTLLQQDNTNTTAHFFIGMSYMESKLYDKAIKNFNAIINQKDTAFVEHAEWYMALCFVKTNQNTQASGLLNQIAASNSFYRIKAIDLLKKL